jgi:hypothetical protein
VFEILESARRRETLLNRSTKILQEPLLHFLAAAALLFAGYRCLKPESGDADARSVQIGEGEVRWIKETWSRQWLRDPTPEELRGLVSAFLKEELLAREARQLGLDKDDVVVRRRLAQKMTFLVQDTSRVANPTDDELLRFYDARPDLFTNPARVSFTHVYFSRQRRRNAEGDAKAALSTLSRTPTAHRGILGDPLLVEPEIRDADEQAVAAQFGPPFARAVFGLSPGSWHGPMESGYGLHLVRVSEAKPKRQREFTEVKAQVLERWRGQKSDEAEQRYIAALLKKYKVVADDKVKDLIAPLESGKVAAR